jgi:hypothetical protein
MVALKTFLVGVERPCYPGSGDSITVTDDYDGFGPGLLAIHPVERVDAKSAPDAGWDYAYRHKLSPILATVNLPEEYSEWMLGEGGYSSTLITWSCITCGTENEDNVEETCVPLCTKCGAVYDWGDLKEYRDWLEEQQDE